MWSYSQSSGQITWDDEAIGIGYSGHGVGKNNPMMQAIKDVGPIPQGTYSIGEPFDTESHGPFVLRLSPTGATNTFGRSGFLIHGDSVCTPGLASEGCIILSRVAREHIARSEDKDLTVAA